MRRRPLVAVSVALTVLGVAVVVGVLQRDAGAVREWIPPTHSFASSSPTPGTPAPGTPGVGTPVVRTPAPGTPAPGTPAPGTPTERAASAVPRLAIPSIRLDHAMLARGISSDGTINPVPGTVMWFDGVDRVRPGTVGTAVVAAHVKVAKRRDVFADLADVKVGDAVYVVEADGSNARYTVTRASAINKHDVTTDQAVWGANTSISRLAIITCDYAQGIRGDGRSVANFVVIAERQ